MKFWIIPIVIGLVLGVGFVLLFSHHGGGMTPMVLRRAPAAAMPSQPAVSQGTKIGAIIAGIILALVPNATVKQIGAALSAAGIGALFADHGT